MGYKTASFKGKREVVRRIHIPFCKCFPVRETIKSHIEFNGRELSAVIFEPISSGKGLGIEPPPPVIIEETAAAYF